MYQRRQQISTTRRQWRYLSSRMRQWVKDGSFALFTAEKKEQLQRRLQQLFRRMLRIERMSKLRKALGAAALLLGLGAVPAQAQVNFAPIQENPFGLVPNDEIRFETLVDIDGDGDLDIVSVAYENSNINDDQIITVRENVSTNNGTLPDFATPVNSPFGIMLPDLGNGTYVNPEFGDLDGDGDLDLLIGLYNFDGSGQVFYLENVGDAQNPAFGEPTISPFGIDLGATEVATPTLVDIDGDGDLDLFSLDYQYDYFNEVEIRGIVFQENIGTATQPSFDVAQNEVFGLPLDYGAPIFLEFGDIDNDGDMDLLAGTPYYDEDNYDDYTLNYQFYENIGNATTPSFAAVVEDPFGLQSFEGILLWPMLGDLDNDGDLDVLNGLAYNPVSYESAWVFQENLLLNVGVNDLADEQTQIKLFPTVGDGLFQLSLQTEGAPLELTLKVFSSNGQLLQQKQYDATVQLNEALALGGYPAGAYHVQLRSGDQHWVGQVIVQQ